LFNCLSREQAKHKAQQKEVLQPPPLKPEEEPPELDEPDPREHEPLKEEICFFTLFELHLGQIISSFELPH